MLQNLIHFNRWQLNCLNKKSMHRLPSPSHLLSKKQMKNELKIKFCTLDIQLGKQEREKKGK